MKLLQLLKICRVLVIALFLFTSSIGFGQYYKLPFVDAQSNMNLFILGIEKGDTTKVDMSVCNFTIDNYNFWMNSKGADNAYYLEDATTNNTYSYLGESGSSSEQSPYSLSFNACDTITL